MISKYILLKDLPQENKGFIFYERGNKVSDDLKNWFKPIDIYKQILDIKYKNEWVKIEQTDITDDRPHLQTLLPNIKLYNVYEMLDALGWCYDKTETGANNIKCCGQKIDIGGWVGSEHGRCRKCNKGFQDITGILPLSNSTVGMIDLDTVQFDDGRIYAIDESILWY